MGLHMATYRKKPIIVEAVQLGDDLAHPAVRVTAPERGSVEPRGIVRTKHGQVFVNPGDWLIAELDGSGFYPCKPDIFTATYEAVDKPKPTVEELDKLLNSGDNRPVEILPDGSIREMEEQ